MIIIGGFDRQSWHFVPLLEQAARFGQRQLIANFAEGPLSMNVNRDHNLVPWDTIDAVLLDMDGTLLDLNYENQIFHTSYRQPLRTITV